MRILISNDDGYKAQGIHVLARLMAQFGQVTVVAPKFHQSAMSTAVSLGAKQLAYKDLPEEGPGAWTYLDATPASCVKFGLQFKYEARNPDLVVCGINHGYNASTAANYSATLGATEEAAINGLPSIGVSIADFAPQCDFSAVEALFPRIVKILWENWPKDVWGLYYNVNFPALPLSQIKGVRMASMGKGHWIKEFEPWAEEKLGDLTDSFLWRHQRVELEEGEKAVFMRGDFVNDDASPAADHLQMQDGWVTIVPCSADLTNYPVLEQQSHLSF